MGNLARTHNIQPLLAAHYENVSYKKMAYENLTVDSLRVLKRTTGVELTNKSNQPFFIRRRAIIDKRNERILESSVSYEVENGFGDVVLTGNAQSVYEGLCGLTDSDVPF